MQGPVHSGRSAGVSRGNPGAFTMPDEPTVRTRRGFSLIDLLVSMAVIAVLLAMVAPALSRVRETTRKVICSSNARQLGLGVAMYADMNRGWVPPSVFPAKMGIEGQSQPQDMQIVRLETNINAWDGLGVLYSEEFTPAAGVFYCPSHFGQHPLRRYDDEWSGRVGLIVSNYHYRALDRSGYAKLDRVDPSTSLVTDGLQTLVDYNHQVGCNVLRADLGVGWFADEQGVVAKLLPRSVDDGRAADRVEAAWKAIDRSEIEPADPEELEEIARARRLR